MKTVIAGIVTYGDRAHLCGQAVKGALRAGADHVVIVDNGSSPDSRERLVDIVLEDARLTLLRPRGNRGSAAGFSDAIIECAGRGDFVWLLDDDNVPDLHALTALQTAMAGPEVADQWVFFSRRLSDAFHARIVDGSGHYPPPGSFMNFDVPVRLYSALRRRVPNGNRLIEVPYGPYGGIFARSSVLMGVAPPRESMFLYEDDTEYTLRLAKNGARLYLCQYSIVRDVDEKWSESVVGRGPKRLMAAHGDARMTLSVRNRAWIDWTRGRRHRGRYLMNKFVYFGAAFIQAVRYGQLCGLWRLSEAVRVGERIGRRREWA